MMDVEFKGSPSAAPQQALSNGFLVKNAKFA